MAGAIGLMLLMVSVFGWWGVAVYLADDRVRRRWLLEQRVNGL